MNVIINGVSYVPKFDPLPGGNTTPLHRLLHDLRVTAKFTLDEAAIHIGCSKSYLWGLENRRADPSLRMAGNISRAYGISLEMMESSLMEAS